MNVTEVRQRRTPMHAGLGLMAAVGLAAAEVATYWDDSWHTDKGRDEFAVPPHLLLYGGVFLAAIAVAAWGVSAWRDAGWRVRGVRDVLRDPAMKLAAIGGVTTLASAPLDNWWHTAFGRDAVLWSPPHLAAVVGTLALVVGLAAGLRDTRGRGASTARLFAGAGIIGALQIPVLEYDSNVPQFSTVWFLPVAALGLCAAVALLDDLLPGRWAPAKAALLYTILRAGTVALLAVLGFSLTVVPPVLPLLLILGAVAFLPLGARLILLGAMSPLVWWPILQAQSSVTTTVPASQLPAAILLGAAGGVVVALVHGDLRRRTVATAVTRGALVLGLLALAVVDAPGRAWAHDPGQGKEVREVRLSVTRDSGAATLTIAIPGDCDGLEPVRVAARRAGQTISAALGATRPVDDGCVATGTVSGLTSGLWFVYTELRSADGDPVEAWLPVGEGAEESATRSLYVPSTADRSGEGARNAVGAVVLLIVVGILIGCLRLARQVSPKGRGNR